MENLAQSSDHMSIEQIKTLSLSDQLLLLKKNCNTHTHSKIKKDIEFFENSHPIRIDEDKADYFQMQDVEDGEGRISKKSVRVRQTRLELPYPQQIVANMVAFLYGNDIDLVMNGDRNNEEQKSAFAKFEEIWKKDLRMMSLVKKATRACGVETRAAIQFLYDADNEKIKGKVLSLKDGYKIYRHKDNMEKVDAIVVEYKRDKIEKGKLVTNVNTTEIWTAEGMQRYEGTVEVEAQEIPLKTKKLLFAYLEQDYSEFEFVKELISIQDYARSQHSDVNVRIGNPALVVYGEIANKPTYNATVKVYEVKGATGFDAKTGTKGSMEYLEVAGAPESVALEFKNNENDIYRFTWPDLNKLMTEMKNGNLSTQSMKLTFLQAFVKVAEKREIHDEFISRIISIVKDMATEIYPEFKGMKDLDISFNYNSLLPDSNSEIVNMLAVAVGAGITSIENAVRILSINTPETMKEIMAENLTKAVAEAKVAEANKSAVASADGVENARNEKGLN